MSLRSERYAERREEEEVNLALRYSRWRERILAVRDRVIQGGGGGLGMSLEGMQESMMLRNHVLNADHDESMSVDRIASQGVEQRSSLILEMPAFLYSQMRRWEE